MSRKDTDFPIFLFHEGNNCEAYKLFSPRRIRVKGVDGWLFRVWAPHARAVSVVGDFNGWDREANSMKLLETTDGIWEAFVPGLKVYDVYKFCVTQADGKQVMKADPYALHSETSPATGSKLYESTYKWTDGKWMAARANSDPYSSPMNIYEVHIGSWRKHDDGNPLSYRDLAVQLRDYVKEMGYTHVEILPVTEYPFEGSWGYQVTGMFAPTSRYGAPDDFKYFVDVMHKAGIGVILDWVAAHFPKDEHGLYNFDGKPLYEYTDPLKAEHREWGTMVFDYGRQEVVSFLLSSASFWLSEYHIDGIRMDAVASMLYLDYGRQEWRPNAFGGNYNLEAIDFLKKLNTNMLKMHPGALMIAEESTAFPMVTRGADMGGLGFNFKWNMGWMNDMLRYVSANPFFRKDMHNNVTFAITYAFSENYILPLSHDEVVHGKCSLINKMPGEYEEKFEGLKTFLGFMMAHPGKKLLFMGGEFAQFIEWDYKRPLDWFLLDYPAHRNIHNFVKDLNAYYLKHPEMYMLDTSYDGFKWIVVDDNTQNIVSFVRYDNNGGHTVAVFNFSPVERKGYEMGVPQAREYKVALCSTDEKYGGKGYTPLYRAQAGGMHSQEYHITMDIPPSSVTYLVPGKKITIKKNKIDKEGEKQ